MGINPYDEFDSLPKPSFEPQGWCGSNHHFLHLKPEAKRVAEIGVWKGASVIELAKSHPQAEVLAVDHFRGSSEHWLKPCWRGDIGDLYRQFISNIILADLEERVVPFPTDSLSAASFCTDMGLQFDLIHIDGAHSFWAVIADLHAWSDLLEDDGIIVMDDYHTAWSEVIEATNQFCRNAGFAVTRIDGNKATIERRDGKH